MNNYPRFTLRVPKSMLKKLAYIAKFNGRTKNKEIEMLIRKHVNEFERLYGNIAEIEEDE